MTDPLDRTPVDVYTISPQAHRQVHHQAHQMNPTGFAGTPGDPLMAQVERWMADARPRLLRLARTRGIVPDSADDVVQETLLEAWRHLDHLSSPAAFDAWLNGICRNVCRRYARRDGMLAGWQAYPHDTVSREVEAWSGTEELAFADVADLAAHDPLEELERQDRERLLDHALGHLPRHLRQAIELCYLAELPQREAAMQLGLTIRSLESQLLRARKRLRQLLTGELRAEAETLDLPSDDDVAAGWRETRMWCWWCGRRRMHGMFEALPDGRVALAMRCPGCVRAFNTQGLVPLDRVRSFRPAHKRLTRYLNGYLMQGVTSGWQTCIFCGVRQPVRIVGPQQLGDRRGRWPGLQARMECVACGEHLDCPVGGLLWSHPAAQRFFAQHPRWISEPEEFEDYLGAPAIRARLSAVGGAGRLTLFAHSLTLQVLATFSD